jgi:presenilin-like A22 family membrane protease
MLLTMASVGTVFGRILSPWTAMILMLVLSIYDILAVRFGYMMWMVAKLNDTDTLPAFILPRHFSEWNISLKKPEVAKLVEKAPAEREFSILGGGDIEFPLLLVAAVYFAYSFTAALIVSAFSLVGLIGAYWIQAVWLKGKSTAALPPIAIVSLIGLLIIRLL